MTLDLTRTIELHVTQLTPKYEAVTPPIFLPFSAFRTWRSIRIRTIVLSEMWHLVGLPSKRNVSWRHKLSAGLSYSQFRNSGILDLIPRQFHWRMIVGTYSRWRFEVVSVRLPIRFPNVLVYFQSPCAQTALVRRHDEGAVGGRGSRRLFPSLLTLESEFRLRWDHGFRRFKTPAECYPLAPFGGEGIKQEVHAGQRSHRI